MKIITLEEHFQLAEIKKAVAKMLPSFAHGFHLPAYDAPDSQLEDLGADRLHHMDAMGIDVQVLSYPSSGIQGVPAAEAIPTVLLVLRPSQHLIPKPLPPNSNVL